MLVKLLAFVVPAAALAFGVCAKPAPPVARAAETPNAPLPPAVGTLVLAGSAARSVAVDGVAAVSPDALGGAGTFAGA